VRWKFAIPILIALSCLAQEKPAPPVEEAVAPVYPELAVLGRIAGSVIVAIHVSDHGAVADANVVEGEALLRQASLDAARQWRFGSQAGGSDLKLIFSYKLMAKGTPEAELGTIFRPPYTVEVRKINPGPVHHYARAAAPERDKRPD
jgi:TonB family protein